MFKNIFKLCEYQGKRTWFHKKYYVFDGCGIIYFSTRLEAYAWIRCRNSALEISFKKVADIYKRLNTHYVNKLLGSSKYRFTNSDKIVLKEKKTPIIPTFETETVTDGFKEDREQYLGIENRYVSENETQSIEVEHLEKEQREYRLNKKKVREKCSAFFGLKQSRRFLAFYTFSFPCGFPDENALRCLNSVFTSMRETCGLKTYLRVSEYQKNGTIHFHVLTNNYMYVRRVNSLMAKSIAYQIKRYKLDVSFDIEKYNGVDVKHVNNNKKALNGYLTKYVSKNDIVHYKIPYHSSRDISELFL